MLAYNILNQFFCRIEKREKSFLQSVQNTAYLNRLTCKDSPVLMTHHRSKFPIAFSEFCYEIKTWFTLVWLQIIKFISLDRKIIEAWIDIIRFAVVVWADQSRVS